MSRQKFLLFLDILKTPHYTDLQKKIVKSFVSWYLIGSAVDSFSNPGVLAVIFFKVAWDNKGANSSTLCQILKLPY